MGKQTSGFRKTHTGLQKGNYNNSQFTFLLYFAPSQSILFVRPNWTFWNTFLNMLKWIPHVLWRNQSSRKGCQCFALMSAQATTAHCSLAWRLSVLLCLRHSLRSSRQANSARKWSSRSNPKQQGMRVWDQYPHSSAQHHCPEACSTQPLTQWLSFKYSEQQSLWALFLSCLTSLTLHYCIYWELPFK